MQSPPRMQREVSVKLLYYILHYLEKFGNTKCIVYLKKFIDNNEIIIKIGDIMIKDEITRYPVSEYFTVVTIKTKLFGITINSTCYIVDKDENILKLI